MANYYLEGDGLFPLNLEPNTPTTTFVASNIPEGAIVVVGRSTANGWVPLTNGTLQNHLPVALSHGQDIALSILVNGAGESTIIVDTQKQGIPDYYNILNQIAENTAHLQPTPTLRTTDVLRVAWKPSVSYPNYQIAQADNTASTITYTDVTETSEAIEVDVATGVFTVVKDVSILRFSIAGQCIRETGAGNDTWGLFIETSIDGSNWVAAEDSTRFLTFPGNVDDDIHHINYTVYAKDLPSGILIRLRQLTSDVSDGIGLVTSQPFANAPVSAGIIISIDTEFNLT